MFNNTHLFQERFSSLYTQFSCPVLLSTHNYPAQFFSLEMSKPPIPCPPEFCRGSQCISSKISVNVSKQNRDSEFRSFMVMTTVVSIFSISVFIIAVYYVYLRRYWNTHRGISRSRPFTRRAADFVFLTSGGGGGLDKDISNSLPVFLYKPEDFTDGLSCSVCLCEFQQKEKAKLLPACKHSFHVDCIDMWFYSHSTCPLCRASVDKQPEFESSVELGDREMEVSIGEQANENMTLSGEQFLASSFASEQVEEHIRSTTHAIDIK